MFACPVYECCCRALYLSFILLQFSHDHDLPQCFYVSTKFPPLSVVCCASAEHLYQLVSSIGEINDCYHYLSPSLRALNCRASRQLSRGPTRPPGSAGSEMAPTHRSMLCGVL